MSAVSIPFTFIPDTTAVAGQVNANFAALAAGFGTIDNSNVGSLGFYASQIIPLTAAQATFGGAVAYDFPNGTYFGTTGTGSFIGPSSGVVQGPLQSVKSGGATPATVPPLLTTGGTDFGVTSHKTQGSLVITVPSGATIASATATLTGDAVFGAAPVIKTNLVTNVSIPGSISAPGVPGWTAGAAVVPVPQVSAPFNQVQIMAFSQGGQSSVSTARLNVYWEAEGA